MPETVLGAGKSVSQALSDATAVLTAAGCDTPRLDAELLMSYVLGVGRERLVIDAFADLDASAAEHETRRRSGCAHAAGGATITQWLRAREIPT